MHNDSILLASEDPVFLREGKAYALVSGRGGWSAHEVTGVDNRYFRSPVTAQLDKDVVGGVVHQQEHFPAKRLREYWRHAGDRKIKDDCDAACANAASVTRRTSRLLDSLGKKR